MKNVCLVVLLVTVNTCFAQNDSLMLSRTKWETVKIAPGVYLKTFAFKNNLFAANQYVSILEMKQRRGRIDIAANPKLLSITSDFGVASKALAALNGTFFDIANGGSVDYIRSDGFEVNSTRLNAKGDRAPHQKSALLIDKGKLSMSLWDGTAEWEKNLKGEDIMVSGPLLIWDKKLTALLDTTSLIKLRHPRSAVARVRNKVLFITIDGRHEMAAGMTLAELATFMRWIRAKQGINLDGGGSTALWINSDAIQGVINHPSDNKKWDHEGQRKVANVLLVNHK